MSVEMITKGLDRIEEGLERLDRKQKEHADEILMLKQRGSALPMDSGVIQTGVQKFETINGKSVRYFGRDEMLAKAYGTASEDFSLADHVRSVILGTKAASSTAVVPTGVSGSIIDRVRARTAVVEAGAGTIVIDGPMNAARLTGDPTVIEHTEAAADATESDITFSSIGLNPKTLIAQVPLTMELVADSPNLDDLLNVALAGAFGAKLDALAIALILADAGIPTSSASHATGTWAGTMLAITQALAANQELPTALIGNTADFAARASQLASTAGTWLGAPPVLAAMKDLYTTNIAAGFAIFGRFDQALAIALRQALTVEVIRYGKPGTASHLLVATMRAAPVVLQPGKLFIQDSIVP